jgi:cytochrome c oxidase assembly protein subunit 15
LSIPFRKTDKRIFTLSLIEFLAIGFQGWLGAKVVSSNLAPAKITVHMVMALVILSIAIVIIYRAKKLLNTGTQLHAKPIIKKLTIVVLLFTVAQIMMGTQVRESVDILLKNFDPIFRNEIIDHLGIIFSIHRSFSLFIIIINTWLIYEVMQSEAKHHLKRLIIFLGILLIVEILAGVVLSRFALPATLQPVH